MHMEDAFRIEENDDPRTWIKSPDVGDDINGVIPAIESSMSKIDFDRYYASLINMIEQMQIICKIEDATADRNQRYPWTFSYLWNHYRGDRDVARVDLKSRLSRLEKDIAIFRNMYPEYTYGKGLTMTWLRQNRFKRNISFLLARRKEGVIFVVGL